VLDVLERLREASGADAGDFVFRTPKGTPVDADNFNARVWAKLRKRAGLHDSIPRATSTIASMSTGQQPSLPCSTRKASAFPRISS